MRFQTEPGDEAAPQGCLEAHADEARGLTTRQLQRPSEKERFVAMIAAHYATRLQRFLTLRLRNVHDVPDLAQEVFLRLLQVGRYEAIRNPEAYLFTVASRVVNNHTLRRLSDPAFIDIGVAPPELMGLAGDDPAAIAENTDCIEQVERALKQLPPKVRAALILHRVGGHTVREIAEQLGIGRETTKKYLTRATQHCRKERSS